MPTIFRQCLQGCIGREGELAELARSLEAARLVTLTGPGGAGKTRLAIRVGNDIANGDRFRALFADGVWLAELGALNDPSLVPLSVAGWLGVREEAERPLEVTLVDALPSRHLLLVLDNCEHLLLATPAIVDALPALSVDTQRAIRAKLDRRFGASAAFETDWRTFDVSRHRAGEAVAQLP